MTSPPLGATWARADSYEQYVGRWSRPVALRFIEWLACERGLDWLDVGCGTGALTRTILDSASPRSVVGVEPSAAFADAARLLLDDERVRIEAGDADHLPVPDASVDVVVSGLVLNFVPDAVSALRSMALASRPDGTVAAYVWDYAGEMWLMRHFWDAAIEVTRDAAAHHEGVLLSAWQPLELERLFYAAELRDVETVGITVPTPFTSFEDYWRPFLGATGTAPAWLATRDTNTVEEIRALLQDRLPTSDDGSIPLTARAWAVRGVR